MAVVTLACLLKSMARSNVEVLLKEGSRHPGQSKKMLSPCGELSSMVVQEDFDCILFLCVGSMM